MSKVLIILGIIGIISILIGGYFVIFNQDKEVNVKPDLPKSDLNITINGQDAGQIENKCDSDLIKCTKKDGCNQVC